MLAATLGAGALAAVPAVAEAVAPARAASPTTTAVAPVAGRGDLDAVEVALSPDAR